MLQKESFRKEFKAEKQELELRLSQVNIIKSIVNTKAKIVDKFLTKINNIKRRTKEGATSPGMHNIDNIKKLTQKPMSFLFKATPPS